MALGANWSCAMEVALRAINLLAAFEVFRRSAEMTEERLLVMLAMFDQHGAHIRRNLEFSYIATSNHYLSDVVGLLWLGLMLPELSEARAWLSFALTEMLREMDKQVLQDGADFEASTGYHRLALELFLYSFLLCRENNVEIQEHYWQKLRRMFDYTRACLRPDGRAPLIGDTDSGRVLPIKHREADDHAFLLSLGAVLFSEPRFKMKGDVPVELLWILGREGVRSFENLPDAPEEEPSRGFIEASTYILRERDLYLLFNASGVGARGRGSHGHNDALSLEVSACGTSFIVDPGTYVYTANLEERNLFRSTRYHSTVEVDGEEQNTTNISTPFVLGDEAHPRMLQWETGSDTDFISAEHRGYARLPEPVTCKRSVRFYKRKRFWLVEDAMGGAGEHEFSFRFHLAAGLTVRVVDEMVEAFDEHSGARLLIVPLDLQVKPLLEEAFASNDYGAKKPSVIACWT
ncbi:MAG: heparinase II/III family protein, partial [Acidobacteria bacterium]|nr:heparinase II/III family protein [Acidobacteriota bacterium]